ncbi:MAG: hypothetical protein HYY28_07120 [Betaproteobacteria bacterium]|nr:hypothetical protein [Betaproteobacteria bacterium]MBI2960067.1 hypothetical protein [Betaproteobacteria bacterium]
MVKYEIWEQEIERNRRAIERGEPFVTTLRDENLMWKKAEAIVSQQPFEGGEPAAILGDRSGIRDKGKWFVKILNELPDEEFVTTVS